MTPKRIAGIKQMLAKTYPNPSEMIAAREAAKELVSVVDGEPRGTQAAQIDRP